MRWKFWVLWLVLVFIYVIFVSMIWNQPMSTAFGGDAEYVALALAIGGLLLIISACYEVLDYRMRLADARERQRFSDYDTAVSEEFFAKLEQEALQRRSSQNGVDNMGHIIIVGEVVKND